MAHARTVSFAFAGRTVPAETATIRRRIRQDLPAEALKPRRLRALTVLGLVAAIAALTVVLVAAPLPGAAALLLSLVCGCLYGSLFFVGHEVGHGAVVKSRAAQWALMWPAFSTFVLSPTLWRVWHNKVHHGHTNRDEYDPDNFGFPSSFEKFRSVRLVAALTPGSRRLASLLYLPIWFTVHTQVVLWRQSLHCRGFESLDRPRAIAETVAMALLWVGLGWWIGPWASLVAIVIPMLVANTSVMSYVVTNHLLLPLVEDDDQLATTMSVTTHRWLDLLHFNFSHHAEHHMFPAMSSKYFPLVRAELRRHAGDRYLAPPHWKALCMVRHPPVPRSARRADGSGERPKDGRCGRHRSAARWRSSANHQGVKR